MPRSSWSNGRIAQLLNKSPKTVLIRALRECSSDGELDAVLRTLLTDAELANLSTRVKAGIGSLVVERLGVPAKDVRTSLGISHTTLLRARRDAERKGFNLMTALASTACPELRELVGTGFPAPSRATPTPRAARSPATRRAR